MRFYTVEIAGREEILVGFRENEAVYRLNLLTRLVPSPQAYSGISIHS